MNVLPFVCMPFACSGIGGDSFPGSVGIPANGLNKPSPSAGRSPLAGGPPGHRATRGERGPHGHRFQRGRCRGHTRMCPSEHAEIADVVTRVSDLNRGPLVNDATLELRRGEIRWIVGLIGARRTEVLETLFGVHTAEPP